MKSVLLKDVPSVGDDNEVCVNGWIDFKNNSLLVRDFTGCMLLKNVSEDGLNYRDVVSIIGHYNVKGKNLSVYSIRKVNKNRWVTKECVEGNFDDFCDYPYLWNFREDRISLFRLMSKLEKEARAYLDDECDFIEMKSPVLWTSVKEYGEREWRAVIEVGNKKISYVMPQSPEIMTLLSAMGGLQRNYTFGKCFRMEDENKCDSAVEFTQLVITAAFYELEEGERLIEKFFRHVLSRCLSAEANDVMFEQLSFKRAKDLYDTDKPDLRYKHAYYYTETIDNIAQKLTVIPISRVQDTIKSIGQIYAAHAGREGFFEVIPAHGFSKKLGKEPSDKIREKYGLANDFVLMGADKFNDTLVAMMYECMKRIYYFEYHTIPQYAFCWIKDMPFVKDKDLKNTEHCIFSKVQMERIDDDDMSHEYISYNRDLILNGTEIGSGGIRESISENFITLMKFHNIENIRKQYGYYIDALDSGAPPIFTMCLGWERILMKLTETMHIQEVSHLPKDENGRCRITGSPNISNIISAEPV